MPDPGKVPVKPLRGSAVQNGVGLGQRLYRSPATAGEAHRRCQGAVMSVRTSRPVRHGNVRFTISMQSLRGKQPRAAGVARTSEWAYALHPRSGYGCFTVVFSLIEAQGG